MTALTNTTSTNEIDHAADEALDRLVRAGRRQGLAAGVLPTNSPPTS